MKLLSSLSIRTKFVTISSIILVFFVLSISVNIFQNHTLISDTIIPAYKKEATQTNKTTLKNIVDIEVDILSHALKNKNSSQEIISHIIEQTDPIRFFDDKSGYFFAYNLSGIRVNVPINKKDNGKNLLELKDPKGFPFVAEFIKTAKNGGGFVTYSFEKEGQGLQPKLSYVKLIPGTDILIGTGMYIDNVEQNLKIFSDKISNEMQADERTTGVIFVAMLAIVCLVLFILAKSLVKPMKELRDAAEVISNGDFLHRVNVLSSDEVGQTARSINHAFDNVADKVFWYEAILDSIQFPVSVTDLNMNWTFVNKSVLAITGANRSDILGKQCSNWGASICNTDQCGVTCLRRGLSESTFTQPGVDKDFKVNAYYLLDRNSQQIGHIEVVQDITEANQLRKSAEKALKEGMLHAAQQLESVVEVITSASEQLSAQIEQSSRGSEEQTHLIGETATSMEEMNATVLEVAKNASSAATTADQAKEKAEQGDKISNEVDNFINKIHDSAQQSLIDMESLEKQAGNIGHVLNVISDIADQTNLLALNAAIEAARAGDAGRGFAVVADEVRKLAEKTMTATKEVGQAIKGIQEATKTNYNTTHHAVEAVGETTKLSEKSRNALAEIVALSQQSSDKISAIATASEQQSATSEEINRSIENVNRISTETTDAMKQSAQAVTELANQAQVLKRLIDEMKSEGCATSNTLPTGKKQLALGRR